MSGRIRVDRDESGNVEVSSKKPRNLRPMGEEENVQAGVGQPGATGQPTAAKSALKKGATQELKGELDSSSSTLASAASTPKSAMKKGSIMVEASSDLGLQSPAKGGLKKSLKGSQPAVPEAVAEAPSAPARSAIKRSGSENEPKPPATPQEGTPSPRKAKSALKGRSCSNVTDDKEMQEEPSQKSLASGCQVSMPDVPDVMPMMSENSSGGKLKPEPVRPITRPSMFKMNVEIEDDEAYKTPALCKHYFHFAHQKGLWDTHLASQDSNARRSIKMSEMALNYLAPEDEVQDMARTPTNNTSEGKRKSLINSPHIILEETEKPMVAEPSVGGSCEISPLKEMLLVKKPNFKQLRQLLKGFTDAERLKWLNASLDATPPPMPSPLFQTVAAAQWDCLDLLIEYKVDVTRHYEGKSMLKGWIKPNTLLVDSVLSRKGRFVGTMLGDKLEAVAALLTKVALDQKSGGEPPSDAPVLTQVQLHRKRTKSIALKCSRGLMLHTQGHPNLKYELDHEFSGASFSSVRAAIEIDTGKGFAIKAGNKLHELSLKDPEAELWNEIVIMRKLEHPNIIKLFETFEDDTHIFMVFELCEGGELFDRLVSEGSFPEATVMRMAYQMGSGIRHMHELRICHRDIRPEAFCLQDEGPLEHTSVKLIDFETAKEIIGNQPLTTKTCTLHYVAPEVLTRQGYNEKVDIWSLGVVIFVMSAGIPPFDADNELDVLKAIKSANWSFEPENQWANQSQDLKDLVTQLMTHEPEKRPDIDTVMALQRMVQAEAEGAMFTMPVDASQKGEGKMNSIEMQRQLRTTFGMLVEKISDENITSLRKLFKEIDAGSKGMVNIEDCKAEIGQLLQGLDDVKDVLSMLASDSLRGKVNYNMFLATMTDKRRHIRREAARLVFNTFDIDKNGNVSIYEIAQALSKETELRKAAWASCTQVSQKEVEAIWQEMHEVFGGNVSGGESADQELSFEEFFKKLPKANLDICV